MKPGLRKSDQDGSSSTKADISIAEKKDLPESIMLYPSNYVSKGLSREGLPLIDNKVPEGDVLNEPLVEMESVDIKYGERQILGGWKQNVSGKERDGLWWTIRRGERWGVFGPNGKTFC